MNNAHPTLLEVLHPCLYADNPKRTEATRTVIQPSVDRFEQHEAAFSKPDRVKASVQKMPAVAFARKTLDL